MSEMQSADLKSVPELTLEGRLMKINLGDMKAFKYLTLGTGLAH